MTPGLSLYLDLLRLMAALQVVVYHLGKIDAAGLGVGVFNAWGHEAVVIFFVLSGFVISHTASTNDKTIRQYTASRVSRIYSVVVPCLLLTVVFDSIGLSLAPTVYDTVNIANTTDAPLARLFICLLMLNESWASLRFFSNGPYWSVAYEVWYYALFACCFYLTGWQRLVSGLVVALIAGPRILLLLPVWLLGVAAYRAAAASAWRTPVVWFAFLQPVLVVWLYLHFELRLQATVLANALGDAIGYGPGWSASALSDYVLGLSFALHLVAAKRLDQPLLRALQWALPVIRRGAASSFTLYLMHQPLLYMLAANASVTVDGPIRPMLILAGTIAIPMLMGPWIEGQRRRLRPLVKRAIGHFVPERQPGAQVTGLPSRG